MTATIVTEFDSRIPQYRERWSDENGRPLTTLIDADSNAGRDSTNKPGQLWERLGDATLNADALTESQWERMATRRNELGTRSPFWGLTTIDDE